MTKIQTTTDKVLLIKQLYDMKVSLDEIEVIYGSLDDYYSGASSDPWEADSGGGK